MYNLVSTHYYYYYYRLGLLSDEPVDLQGTPLKALSSHLEKQLVYGVCIQ